MNERSTKKIFVTGGHVTPALAVIEEIQRQKLDWEIVFVGRKYAMEGDSEVAEEYRLITNLGIRFLPVYSGRFTRTLGWSSLIAPAKFLLGVAIALRYSLKEKPQVIVSFGGYVALPVAIAGWILRIPIITHEQTYLPGLANRLIAILAKRVCVSFPETLNKFPQAKTVLTGLPFRRKIFSPPLKTDLTIDQGVPLIYITGGSTGSVSLNRLVYPIVPTLTRKFMLIHQTGRRSLNQAQSVRLQLSEKEQLRYLPLAFLDIAHHSWVLAQARLLVGRAGANTVGEVAATGKVGIFIPLPWSAAGEQQKNAQKLSAAGSALVLQQENLTPQLLLNKIEEVITNIAAYRNQAQMLAEQISRTGDRRLTQEIINIIGK